VAVKGNSRQAIVGEYVVDDDVSRDGSDSAAVGKDANASASARGLVAVPRGGVVGNGVVNNAVVRACWTLRAELGSVRCEHDSAGVGIALEEVSGDEIVVGLAGVVTDEETAGVVLGDVIGEGGPRDAHDVQAFATVEAFTG
jgi:hypothetical protein